MLEHQYDITWNDQSHHAGESMPLGGFDLGCNVWVEDDELLIYMGQSGAFDDQGNLLKAGRLRIGFDQPVFDDAFRQELMLEQGCIHISGRWLQDMIDILLWCETERSALHVEISASCAVHCTCKYESWRDEDIIESSDGQITFVHRNDATGVMDARLAQQEISHLKPLFPDVERYRTSGGRIICPGMTTSPPEKGQYLQTAYTAWRQRTIVPVQQLDVQVYLLTLQTETTEAWYAALDTIVYEAQKDAHAREDALIWWHDFWQRSYVHIDHLHGTPDSSDWQVGRNYQLFRYMQAGNARGVFPTKFNGGLFTVDPCVWHDPSRILSPDYREWGGAMFTAQNQRLVYWPMIRNGDWDMMRPQFDFYQRLVLPMKKRTEHFFGLTDCACYCEQIDVNGLSGYYGLYGVDYPLQVRHHYVEALEFAYMILRWHRVSQEDIVPYMPFIRSVLDFYDRMYPRLDERGRRIIFPSTAMETYHGTYLTEIWGEEGRYAADYDEARTAVTNPADVIAALDTTLRELLAMDLLCEEDALRYRTMLEQLPPIPTEMKKGHLVIAPCESPMNYRKGNCEFPQLNTVHPYQMYNLFESNCQLPIDTYWHAWDHEDQLDHISWHPNGCYAARLGLTAEAHRYMCLKLRDSERRFPAFWGPGHDYTPDHNWGGSGMMVVQEMLLQTRGKQILLLPAWPVGLDVTFRLWADERTCVDVRYEGGQLDYSVTPAHRAEDVLIAPTFQHTAKEASHAVSEE